MNPHPTIGATVAAAGTLGATSSTPGYGSGRRLAPRRGHWRSSERRHDNWWGRLRRQPYRVGQSESLALTNGADTLVQREPVRHRPRRLVDAVMVVDQRDFLQRNRLLSIGRLRISLRLADCKHHVQHHLHRQWRIDNSNSGGDREPGAQLHLASVAPGHFQRSCDRSLRRHGDARPGLHGRKFVCRHRRSGRSQLKTPPTLDVQVLRLDSPTSGWVEDQNFIPVVTNKSGTNKFGAVAMSRYGAFRSRLCQQSDYAGRRTYGWVLESHNGGLSIGQKTVTTGSVGAQGTWTLNAVEPPNGLSGQIRSFASYTDSVTHEEMAFAGTDPYGIFSGAFNSATNSIQWGATVEAGTSGFMNGKPTGNTRVMSFASCGGKLYASIYDAIVVRTDGPNPSWQKFYQYSGPALPSTSSGFRGLTCVPNLNGAGSMLIAALEGSGDIYDIPLDGSQPTELNLSGMDIYDIPLDGSQPTIELDTSNYLGTQLGTWVAYVFAAYNNMIVYPQSGATTLPRSSHWSQHPRRELCRCI